MSSYRTITASFVRIATSSRSCFHGCFFEVFLGSSTLVTYVCEHTAHSTLKGTLQGVLRRSPGRSRPQELGHYGLTRQPYGRTRLPEGWVREFSHTPNSFRRHLYISTRHSAEGLGRRRGRWPALHTSRPATLARTRGAEGASTRVVLLQLHLGIRAPTQGIFQYNNVLGSPKFA